MVQELQYKTLKDVEIIEVEEEWVHPKDRPKITKEERKANQKLVKEIFHNRNLKFQHSFLRSFFGKF